jgi:hypothetical protein
VGSRIQARIAEATLAAERDRVIARRGNFLWPRDLAPADAPVRSRTGMRMAPDRIAAEEYQAAIRAILGSGHGFSRGQLTTEVRSVLGFGRTGAALDEAIGGVIDALVADGTLGESSSGLRLRSRETRQS